MNSFEVSISIVLLLSGLLTLAFRNRRNSLVGFRIGYTYQSDFAWRKANTFAGLFITGLSLFLLFLAFIGVAPNSFVLIMLAGVLVLIPLGTAVAKRAYELEELSTEAPEKPQKPIEIDVRPYLILQLLVLLAYLLLAATLWERLPGKVAVHFGPSGKPNGFASKTVGILLFPLLIQPILIAMTYLLREPGFAPLLRFSRLGWKRAAELFTLLSVGVTLLETAVLLYNAAFIPSSWVNYSVWAFLGLILVAIYRILRVKGKG
ncbi:DUF1648 domain-containing protein [Thermococcus sp.]|uniref:DUF1648 domain-containing protein n=1 Tax=Thermococcus sp. TaxID=35749 RepID=UPI00260F41B5|nr:DUF1648 domain-containing protein [Thermococcus sp.]